MGFGIKELIVILVIVLLLFGTKRLKSLGSDLGSAIKGFRKSVSDEESEDTAEEFNSISAQLGSDTEPKGAEHSAFKEIQT